MREATLLERSLAALAGGMIGGFVTFALAFSTWHWLIWAPVLIGVLVGYLGGDRGVKGLLKAARWTPL